MLKPWRLCRIKAVLDRQARYLFVDVADRKGERPLPGRLIGR
ncbi:MAG: hypothetical protein P8Q36_05225 [Alphaproteobacteria bacterium]|nr:hypothetical protein [Alphaproteobacteria bacterium]